MPSLKDIVVDFLKENPEQKFTAREIAKWIVKKYPEEADKKKRSTAIVSEKALLQQFCGEIGSKRLQLQKEFAVKTTEGRPRKYYFTNSTDSDEIAHAESNAASQVNGSVVKEHGLYPIFSKFISPEHVQHCMRIDEKRSHNSCGPGGNEWLYPDLVGIEDLSREWQTEIKNCVQQYTNKRTKLWSFEVKVMINRSNVRKAFFQAVSNSSWANFGYLVAGELQGDNTMKELRMLSSLHGIGFIRLDAENFSESQIMIPAKERSEIDWNTADRLAEENKDFLEYIKLIRQFYQTGEIRPSRQSDGDMSADQD